MKLIPKQIKFAKKGTNLTYQQVLPVLYGEAYTRGDEATRKKYEQAYKNNKVNLDQLYQTTLANKEKEYNEVLNQTGIVFPNSNNEKIFNEANKQADDTFNNFLRKKNEETNKQVQSQIKSNLQKRQKRQKKKSTNDWRSKYINEVQANLNFSLGQPFNYNISNGTTIGNRMMHQVNQRRQQMIDNGTWGNTDLPGSKNSNINFSEIPAYEIDELDENGNLKESETVNYKKKNTEENKEQPKRIETPSSEINTSNDSIRLISRDSVPQRINPFVLLGTVGNDQIMGTYGSDSIPIFNHALINGQDSVPISSIYEAQDSTYKGTPVTDMFYYDVMQKHDGIYNRLFVNPNNFKVESSPVFRIINDQDTITPKLIDKANNIYILDDPGYIPDFYHKNSDETWTSLDYNIQPNSEIYPQFSANGNTVVYRDVKPYNQVSFKNKTYHTVDRIKLEDGKYYLYSLDGKYKTKLNKKWYPFKGKYYYTWQEPGAGEDEYMYYDPKTNKIYSSI